MLMQWLLLGSWFKFCFAILTFVLPLFGQFGQVVKSAYSVELWCQWHCNHQESVYNISGHNIDGSKFIFGIYIGIHSSLRQVE